MRLRQLALAAHDLEATAGRICDVLGLADGYADPGVATFGLDNRVMVAGDQFLEVVSPAQPDTTAGRFLERRGGDSGYMVILQVDDLPAERSRAEAAGVRVVWDIDLPDAGAIHLHPRDVGGAILSFDRMTPPESWRWGGPDWQARVREDGATALVGAELESEEPAALAERWSRATGRPVTTGSGGDPEIALDGGGFLRFVRSDGALRGEGLVGIEIACADPERFRAAASEAGVLGKDGSARIGGVRFVALAT